MAALCDIFGNRVIRFLIHFEFKSDCLDVLSGLRGFSRSFMKNIPVLSNAFDVEADITLRTLAKAINVKEMRLAYQEQIAGIQSKSRTSRTRACSGRKCQYGSMLR